MRTSARTPTAWTYQLVMAGTGRESNDNSIWLSYSLGSIPSGTGRLGSEMQDLQPTGPVLSGSTCGPRRSWRNRRDTASMKNHPVFHVSLLRPGANDPQPGQ